MHQNNTHSDLIEFYIPLEERTKPKQPPEKHPEETEYINEIKRYSSIETLTTAALVAVVISTTYYILTFNPLIQTEGLVYMFCLMVAPSAYFLLFLHFSAIIQLYRRGEKSIPVLLDVMYFVFVLFAGATIYFLHEFYQRLSISISLFSAGFTFAILVFAVELLVAFFIASQFSSKVVFIRYPHLFALTSSSVQKKKKHHRPAVVQSRPRPAAYYISTHRSDHTLWQDHPSFVRYKQ